MNASGLNLDSDLLSDVIHKHRDGFLLLDAAWRVLELNPAMERLTGRGADELRGEALRDLCSPWSALEGVRTALHDSLSADPVVLNWATVGHQVSVTECLFQRQPPRPGKDPLFTLFARDISAYRKAEERLIRREGDLRSLFEHTRLGKALAVPSGRLIRVNAMLCELLAYDEHDLLRLRLVDLVHPEDRSRHQAGMRDALQVGQATWSQDIRLLRRDGQVLDARLLAAVVRSRGGQPERLVYELEDLTDVVSLEQALESQREQLAHVNRVATLGELAAGIAHEINQPLTAISGYAYSAGIQLRDGDRGQVGELLGRIADLAVEAGDIIRHLRGLAANRPVRSEKLQLSQVVEDVLRLLHADHRAERLGIDIRTSGLDVDVFCDRVQLQQVLINLIRNAMDALENRPQEDSSRKKPVESVERGVIALHAENIEGYCSLTIRDSGPGVDPDLRERLFEPFVSSRDSGMGMGLAICDTILRQHGGSIRLLEVQKDAPLGGACFELRLRRDAGVESQNKPENETDNNENTGGRTDGLPGG